MLCQIDVINDEYVTIAPLFMGTLTFDHFRNEDHTLALTEFATEWFETLPGDIEDLNDPAAPAGAGDEGHDICYAEATIAGRKLEVAILDIGGKPGKTLAVADLYAADNALVRLAATHAQLLVVRHAGAIAPEVRTAPYRAPCLPS